MDVMLDLETLSTRHESVILTLGAVKFSPWDQEVNTETGLYLRIDVDEQLQLDRHVQQETVDWWGKQAEEVREEALGEHERTRLGDSVDQLNRFLVGAENIWCQGPAFDIVILENLYRQLGRPTPWQFWQISDSRTITKRMLKDPRKDMQTDLHNALADALKGKK